MNKIIETQQLILRELTHEDLHNLHNILSDTETMKYYPKPFDLERTKGWIDWNIDNYNRYGFGLWAVILKEENRFIGDCGITMQNIHHDGNLFPEIGYHIDKKFRCMGYASQAARACLRYAFEEKGLNEVFSYQKWTNLPSRRVAEKMGMTLREEYEDKVNIKTSVYSITKDEYFSE